MQEDKLGNNVISKEVNILVVDDEEVIRSFLSDALTDVGYSVEVASSGEEALEKTKQIPFEILIVDLKMPGMNGVEVIKKFKEANSDVCAIVMTGYPSIESVVETMRQGAYDYITKPFNLDELKIVIRRAAEKQILQREKEAFRELSITDVLTGGYNRRYLEEVLPREIERANRYCRNLSFMMIDIDDFKVYNDTNGHVVGDVALKQITQVFFAFIRKVDFIFRYGGEEFAILLPETEKEGCISCARRIRGLIERGEFKATNTLSTGRLTISIGVAVYPDDATSGEELIKKADEALYQAKRSGKNAVSFFEIKEIKTSREE